MGQELNCRVTLRGAQGESESEGKGLLETSEIVFRGDFRLRIPFSRIQRLEVRAGALSIAWPEGEASFELGPQAGTWAEKIRNPRGLLDKLGVNAGNRVSVLGVEGQSFLAQLRARTPDVTIGSAAAESHFVFYEAGALPDLDRLSELRRYLKSNGAIWVVSPKGKGASIRDVDVIEAAKAAGLIDTKVVSFSSTHTALKLVIPVAMRAEAGTRTSGSAPDDG